MCTVPFPETLYRGTAHSRKAAPRGALCQRGAAAPAGSGKERGFSRAAAAAAAPAERTAPAPQALLGRPHSRRLDGDLRHPRGWGAAPPAGNSPAGPEPTALPGSAARPPLLPSPAGRAGAAPRRRRLPVQEEEEPEPRSHRDKVDSEKFTAGGKRRAESKGEGRSRPTGRSRGSSRRRTQRRVRPRGLLRFLRPALGHLAAEALGGLLR